MKNLKYILPAFLIILIAGVSFILLPGCEETYSSQIKGEEIAVLTSAPNVPPPITRNHASKVIVHLETTEETKRLADGVDYTFWTFGGDVPGKFIRVKEGDLIEFHLHNAPDSKMPHNIDLHAVTGPGGGASSSFTAPAHTSVFSFKAINAGLYVYHCATAPVGLHIANGMYGLILVEPQEGLPPVDREYYVMQSEFYTEGKFGEQGVQNFSQQKAEDENPSYVVFNGSVGSLVDKNSIKAKKGEKIRLYLGNGGPNLISSFHVIGEIFDNVYGEGGTVVSQKNVQTTLIPAGGSAIVDFQVDVPGTYILVDHSIFRAFHKGAIGMLQVEGEEDLEIYSGKQKDEIYFGREKEPQEELTAVEEEPANSIEQIMALGKSTYDKTCAACHMPDGNGLPNVFPPVKNSDFVKGKSKEEIIKVILTGMTGPITVNGKAYNGIMPPQNTLSDVQIASVLTYVYKEMGNGNVTVTPEEVRKVRSSQLALH